jgi:hypothetical protein
VDDFVFYFLVPWHDACEGLAGGCPVCLRALADPEANDAWWTESPSCAKCSASR